MSEELDALELELRRLPGVVGVGFSGAETAVTVHLFAPGNGARDELRRRASQLAQMHLDGAIVEIDDGNGPVEPGEGSRVRLIAVRVDQAEGEVEVHLSHGERRTVGRGPSQALRSSAEATFDALVQLGAHLPFTIGEVLAIGQEGVQTVLVALQPKHPSGGTRHGAADGARLEEAAARATLHALNRWLSGAEAFRDA